MSEQQMNATADIDPGARTIGLDSDTPITGSSSVMPIAEAMAHAMAMQAHQHSAAVPEDAPATPGRLPFPRPPFDAVAALTAIFGQESAVDELATIAERAKRAAKAAKDEWEEAVATLGAMIRRYKAEQAESSREPGQPQFWHGLECAWEKENPGRVCGICMEDREKARQARAASNGDGTPEVDKSVEIPDTGPEPIIVLGTIAIAKVDIEDVCEVGERGVCFDVNEESAAFIFQTGGYQLLNSREGRDLLTVTSEVCGPIAKYKYKSDAQLEKDFNKGKFDAAFPEGTV